MTRLTQLLLAWISLGCNSLVAQDSIPSRIPLPEHQPIQQTRTVTAPNQPGRAFVRPPEIPEEVGPKWFSTTTDADASGEPFSLEMLLGIAQQHNPTLRQAQLQVNSQLGKAIQAGLYPNPRVSYVGEQIGIDVMGNTDSPGEWQGAEVEQRIVTAGKLRLSQEKYLQRAKVAEFLSIAQQYRVFNDIRIHFFKTLATGRIVELRRELLKNAQDHVTTVREMYNLGQATQVEAYQANARLQQHRLAVMQVENEQRQRLFELSSLVGVELMLTQLEGSLESTRELIDFDNASIQLLESSPEIHAAHAKLRADGITVDRERVEWVPDVVVSVGAGYNYEATETTAAARVSLEIPLFDRNQGTIQQAESDYLRQQNEIRRTELRLRMKLAAEYSRYLTAVQNVQNYEAVILPAKRDAYQLQLKSYKQNRVSWPEVLHLYEEYTLSRIDFVMYQLQQRIQETVIDGYLLHGGLEAAEGPLPTGHIDSVPKPR